MARSSRAMAWFQRNTARSREARVSAFHFPRSHRLHGPRSCPVVVAAAAAATVATTAAPLCARASAPVDASRPLALSLGLTSCSLSTASRGPLCCRTQSRSPETDCTVARPELQPCCECHSLCADRLPTANRVPLMLRMHRAPSTDVLLQRATPSTALPCRRLSRRTTGSAYRDKQHHHPSFGPRLPARGWRRYLACLTPPPMHDACRLH